MREAGRGLSLPPPLHLGRLRARTLASPLRGQGRGAAQEGANGGRARRRGRACASCAHAGDAGAGRTRSGDGGFRPAGGLHGARGHAGAHLCRGCWGGRRSGARPRCRRTRVRCAAARGRPAGARGRARSPGRREGGVCRTSGERRTRARVAAPADCLRLAGARGQARGGHATARRC